MKIDRIRRAHQLRTAIHAWLTINQPASMAEILAAFCGVKTETVRKSVRAMRDSKSVAMVGATGLVCRYATTGLPPPTEDEMRLRMVTGDVARANAARLEVRKREQDPELAARSRKPEPWRTVYHSGDNPEIAKNQRGQGALRARVHISCARDY